MKKTFKKRASSPDYISTSQLTFDGFESPFSQNLDPSNRWVVLSNKIPWDELSNIYLKQVKPKSTGRPGISPRVVIGSLIIKHMCNLDDRETVAQITENMYMQYFLGYSSFTTVPPFDPSLFVEFRNRLGMEQVNAINDRIVGLSQSLQQSKSKKEKENDQEGETGNDQTPPSHKGRVLFDATACPQDIAYPTDLNLLSEARKKSEQLIDILYSSDKHEKKPRTYREKARKQYLQTAQKKIKQKKVIRKAVGQQLRYLRRNLKSINPIARQLFNIPLVEPPTKVSYGVEYIV